VSCAHLLFFGAALALAACAPPPPAVPAPAAVQPACPEEDLGPAYVPRAASTVPPPALPVPAAPVFPIKDGDAYTVRGAIHHLRSRVHADEITRAPITIVGTIVRENFAEAPRCAQHRTGRGDPEQCRAPLPSFALADAEGPAGEAIEVLGWSSNWAQIYTLLMTMDRAKPGAAVTLRDEFLGHVLPMPLPAVGAKVRVTGHYGVTFNRGPSPAADTQHGILTFESMTTLAPGPKEATLPGMKRKRRR
jgi:hypothetical protein